MPPVDDPVHEPDKTRTSHNISQRDGHEVLK